MRKWLINFTSCREEECTENMQCLRERADEELYNAKENGRGYASIKGSCYRSKRWKRKVEESGLLGETGQNGRKQEVQHLWGGSWTSCFVVCNRWRAIVC